MKKEKKNKKSRKPLWIVLGALLLLGAVGSLFGGSEAETSAAETATRAVSMATPAPTAKPSSTATPVPTTEPTSTPKPSPTPRPSPTPEPERDYVLNTNTMRFHKPTCSSVTEIAPQNRQDYHGFAADLEENGYQPCGRCNPK